MTEPGAPRDQDPWLHREVVARRQPAATREWVGDVLDWCAPVGSGTYRVQPDRTALQLEDSLKDMVLYATRVRSRHLIVVRGDVELEILGPHATEEARFADAQADDAEDGEAGADETSARAQT
jgi:hypothetical protein